MGPVHCLEDQDKTIGFVVQKVFARYRVPVSKVARPEKAKIRETSITKSKECKSTCEGGGPAACGGEVVAA